MIYAFIAWTLICAFMFCIGIKDYNSKEAVGFWSGTQPPEVKDLKKYNHGIGTLWMVYAIAMEIFGLPMACFAAFLEVYPHGYLMMLLGGVLSTLGIIHGYMRVVRKWTVK